MKKGTIIRNHWAGENNPTRFFIYLGITGKFVNGIELSGSRLNTVQYYKSYFVNSDKFEVVGYCEAYDIMKKDLKKLIEESE